MPVCTGNLKRATSLISLHLTRPFPHILMYGKTYMKAEKKENYFYILITSQAKKKNNRRGLQSRYYYRIIILFLNKHVTQHMVIVFTQIHHVDAMKKVQEQQETLLQLERTDLRIPTHSHPAQAHYLWDKLTNT